MAGKTANWKPGPTVCRCCLAEGCYKDISTEYFWMGKREVYAEMLTNTFNVSIAFSQSGGPNSNSRLICEPCISRLRDASNFKRQVLDCEKTFMQHLDPGSSLSHQDLPEELAGLDDAVKVERVKIERDAPSDDDFDATPDFLDDDDDELDQPLTNFATKEPKKEAVSLLEELLDNPAVTIKKKSVVKTKQPPAKKVKRTETAKPTSSKVVAKTATAEKKKKGAEPERTRAATSVWQMTVHERRNAATFMQHTTVKPFLCHQANFKCLYCNKMYPEIKSVLEHTADHPVPDRTALLKQFLVKGKRVIKVDISDLKCRICDAVFSDLDLIRQHLEAHGKEFNSAGNGLMAYDLSVKNGCFSCHKCKKEFNTFFLLNQHMNDHFNVVCETCGLGFISYTRLVSHRLVHQNGKHKCSSCSQVFATKLKLSYHVKKWHQVTNMKKLKPLKCPHCLERFSEHYRKMTHLRDVHGISHNFDCNSCKLVFKTRRALTEHTNKVHTQKIQCNTCGKCFGTKSLLKLHTRGHIGVKNFECFICQKKYMHQRTLKLHMKVHGPGKIDFRCAQCGAVLRNRMELNKHVRQWHPELDSGPNVDVYHMDK